MQTTKRKFHALLNSIGSRPSSSSKDSKDPLQTRSKISPLSEELLSKKRRVSASASNQGLQRLEVSGLIPLSLDQETRLMPSKVTITSGESLKYAPWDRDEFLKRLQSFSNISYWTPKPPRVNEVQWAKRGWICQKFERVRCCSCNVEIIVKLNQKEVDGKEQPVYVAHAIEEELVNKYVDLIVSSHHEDCLWRKRGCDDSIFKLPLHHPATVMADLKQRYEELKASGQHLPYLHNLRLPDAFDLERTIKQLPSDFLCSPNKCDQINTTEIDRVAFAMALAGWQGHRHVQFGLQVTSASCQACFRVLGLWIFRSKEMNEAGEELLGATMNCLDVVGEHRAYCPWRNPASQNGYKIDEPRSDALPGWKIVLRVINNELLFSKQQVQTTMAPRRIGESYDEFNDVDTSSTRTAKDKEIKSRLMRVRSLFDPSSAKKNIKNGLRHRVKQTNT
ncbi:unnamed protein product [Blumeria hordei]|uniref:Uncharacterized protein n=2 Tax=Blumeria hordei TaxID=2867405 RepID=A0A383UHS9_BLUHO|nr:C3HC zinc finger domain-containing protein [Blumeria hordei DH14]SZE99831.1 unnamed protein product [Blumeria hordei]